MPTIYHKQKGFLFLHIPKTGGTSICRMIEQDIGVVVPTYGHRPLSELYRPEIVYTVRRCPYSRALSLWRYFGDTFMKNSTFDQFLESLPVKHVDGWLVNPQSWFVGQYRIENLRFETLETDVKNMQVRHGIVAPLGHLNRKQHPVHEWTNKQRILVEYIYADDFGELYDPSYL